jgi:transposase
MFMTNLMLEAHERAELERMVRSQRISNALAKRARVVLALASGETYQEIGDRLGCSPTYIALWKTRFATDRLSGMVSRYVGQPPRLLTPKLEAKILDATRRAPADGSTHWSTRKLGKHLGLSHMTIARVWAKHGLRPHRLESYMVSDDPNFETKAADVIGLYLNPPAHAVVFCVDEKTAIQALDRLDPVLPLSPGRAERHGFEYKRHGTLSLYAAFNTKNGAVVGKTTARHTSAEFVGFLTDLLATQPRRKEIHVIVDNLSAHKTKLVDEFLAAHPNVHLHFTPTYSSWLNQVELWFSKIERDLIARGVFTSVKDLARKIMRYIRHYNNSPKPVKWKYFDSTRRIGAIPSPVTVH